MKVTVKLPAVYKMNQTVQEIILSSNNLKTLPKCIGAFSNLRKLDLYSNNLTTVDADVIGRLDKLRWIDISGNKNIEAKYAKMVQQRLSKEEIATVIKSDARSEFKKLEKSRAKKQKQADKKAEKERLAEKLRLKEERRKAWEESQKQLKSEGNENVNNETDQSEAEESSEESEAESVDEIEIKEKPQSNFICRFVGAIFSMIWFLISKVVWFGLYTAGSLTVTFMIMYYVCLIFPTDPNTPNYDKMICPILTENVKGAVVDWIQGVAEKY